MGDLTKFEKWLATHDNGLAPSTRALYCAVMAGLGSKNPIGMLEKARGMSPSHKTNLRAALRYWAEFTGDEELERKLSTRRIGRLVASPGTKARRKAAALSPDELSRFLDELERTDEPPYARPCIGLMAKLGLRVVDMLRLRLDLVEAAFEDGSLVVIGKGDKARRLPAEPVLGYLEELAEFSGWECLADLISEPREGQDRAAYVKIMTLIQRISKRAGIGKIRTHQLRKAVARKLYEDSDHDIDLVSRILGHANIKTTMIYLETEDWLERAGRLMGGGGAQ